MASLVIFISIVKESAYQFNLLFHASKMKKKKKRNVHIQYVMSKFKNNKNAKEIVKKISSFYSKGVIINRQIRNSFSKFHCGNTSMKNDP